MVVFIEPEMEGVVHKHQIERACVTHKHQAERAILAPDMIAFAVSAENCLSTMLVYVPGHWNFLLLAC